MAAAAVSGQMSLLAVSTVPLEVFAEEDLATIVTFAKESTVESASSDHEPFLSAVLESPSAKLLSDPEWMALLIGTETIRENPILEGLLK